jgi:hypothetical protein
MGAPTGHSHPPLMSSLFDFGSVSSPPPVHLPICLALWTASSLDRTAFTFFFFFSRADAPPPPKQLLSSRAFLTASRSIEKPIGGSSPSFPFCSSEKVDDETLPSTRRLGLSLGFSSIASPTHAYRPFDTRRSICSSDVFPAVRPTLDFMLLYHENKNSIVHKWCGMEGCSVSVS